MTCCVSPSPATRPLTPTIALFAAVDTVEAAVQVGNTDVVGAQVAMVEKWAQRTGATWARTACHRLRALDKGGAVAEASFRAALDVAGEGGHPFEYARTRLLYGEWLRWARRRADARIPARRSGRDLRPLGCGTAASAGVARAGPD